MQLIYERWASSKPDTNPDKTAGKTGMLKNRLLGLVTPRSLDASEIFPRMWRYASSERQIPPGSRYFRVAQRC
jgi:hypothetical protein